MKVKRQFTVFSICFIALLLATTLSVGQVVQNTGSSDYTTQAQKDFANAKIFVQNLLNTTLPNVNLQVVTKQWAQDTWGRGYSDPDLTNILRQEKFYKGIFLIPENASLYQANVDWTANFIAASWGGQIYVIKENFDPWNLPNAEATFVHELTHIWQPNLGSADSFDMDKARTALVEGHANYMGEYYVNQSKAHASVMATVDQVPVFLLSTSAASDLHPMIDTLWDLNYFPYDQGKTFVNTLYDAGGWATVINAYQNPPNTTAQILHPDEYFLNVTNQPVSAPTLSEDTWTKINSDRYGEFFVQLMLENWLPKSDADAVSAGWVGDNFTYYEQGNDYLFTWNIKWDNSCAASDFYIAFHTMMNATGSIDEGSCNWVTNGTRYLSISWNQDLNTTLIACSTVQAATDASYFVQK
jgi:hypothetical protein